MEEWGTLSQKHQSDHYLFSLTKLHIITFDPRPNSKSTMMAVIKIYTLIKDSILNAQVIWYRTIYMKFISSLQEENEGVVE